MNIKAILWTCVATLIALVLLGPGALAQQRGFNVDLVMQEATLKSFSDALSRQTGTAFSYGADLADEPLGNIEVHVLQTPLEKILGDVLTPKGFQFLVVGNSVAI